MEMVEKLRSDLQICCAFSVNGQVARVTAGSQQQQHDDDHDNDVVGTPLCLAGVVWQKQFNITMNLEPSTSTVEKLSINNKAQAIIRLLLLLLLYYYYFGAAGR